ncbi:UbiH/UbiF/VisC/COQ6 family ubiquinone biosynthesis hydroxylase [Rubellimicrobium sp. CFH 75288]|uniref:UbiH/UbiF/VisC/COQ6 family ubiquinone biosynthesis hydroxylase n=1 Tax=Rubellimicrobium sp. CFH 75288 TaxID=2697034 RepID=UPI001FB84538|nr:UbiH/UbiF/VisC/COQ6 family ubiquinone biosynthesis hydroxylase [Rubellimicrobium sp. CFH 75288]
MDNPALAPHLLDMARISARPAPPAGPDRTPEVFDAIVAGGGLTGTALALALGRGGLRVALVEPAGTGRRDDGRAYALALASVRMLRALGAWPAAQAEPIQRILVADGRPGEAPSPLHLAFDAGEIEEGPMGHMIEDAPLREAVETALAGLPEVRRIAGAVVSHRAGPAGLSARLGDGRMLEARVLVGADGRRSPTARQAGIGRIERPYGQTAVTASLVHERPHGGTAHQLFLPGGPVAVLPLPGNRSSLVWSERSARAATLMRMEEAEFLEALRAVLGGFLGRLGPAGPRSAFPLGLSLAEAFTAPRVALAGDAARAVHPVAGQGLNAGLRDVAALAEVLTEAAARGEDIGAEAVLGRYARWRRFDSALLAVATDGFNRLFSNDWGPLRLVRDLGMAAVGRMGPLRRAFIREAAGLTGELPRLMR